MSAVSHLQPWLCMRHATKVAAFGKHTCVRRHCPVQGVDAMLGQPRCEQGISAEPQLPKTVCSSSASSKRGDMYMGDEVP